MTQLAIEFLIEQASAHPTGSQDFIKQLKKRHKVPSGYGDLSSSQRWLAETYVIDSISSFDEFCKQLAREWRNLDVEVKGDWKETADRNTLTAVDRIVANMSRLVRESIISSIDYALLEYYRECRHFFIHRTDDRKPNAAFDKLLQRKHEVTTRYRRVASIPAAMVHGDKTLLSRCLIQMAYRLNNGCDVSTDAAARWICGQKPWFSRMREKMSGEDSLRKQAEGIAQTLGVAKSYRPELVAKVCAIVNAAPNKKVRRQRESSS
jgi:hypothetical protein